MGDVIDDRPLILVAEDNASNYLLIEILLKHTYRLIDGYQDARNEWV